MPHNPDIIARYKGMTPQERNHEFVTLYQYFPTDLSERAEQAVKNTPGVIDVSSLGHRLGAMIGMLIKESDSPVRKLYQERMDVLSTFARVSPVFRGVLRWNYGMLQLMGMSRENPNYGLVGDLFWVSQQSLDTPAGLFERKTAYPLESQALQATRVGIAGRSDAFYFWDGHQLHTREGKQHFLGKWERSFQSFHKKPPLPAPDQFDI